MSFNIKQQTQNNSLNFINTQVLRPITINQDSATFVIPDRGGSLDRHSAIILPAIVSSNTQFLPINTGIASLIKSISLIIGGRVVAENDNCGQFISMANNFKSSEFKDKVTRAQSGVREVMDYARTGRQNLTTATSDPPGKITLKDLKYLNIAGNSGISSTAVDSFVGTDAAGVGNKNYRLTSDPNSSAQYYLYLEQCFPYLYGGLELPMYLISEEVSIVIKFSNNSLTPQFNERILNSAAQTAAGANTNCELILDEVVLLTDYLVPNQPAKEQMVKSVMSDEGLSFVYSDLIYNTYLLEGLPLPAVQDIRNYKRDILQVGLSNKVVRQLYMIFSPTQNNAIGHGATPYADSGTGQNCFGKYNSINPLKNIYCSKSLSYLIDGSKIQVSVNNKNIFNTALESSAHKQYELQVAMGKTFNVCRSSYDFSDMTVDEIDKTVDPAWGGLQGSLFYEKSLISGYQTVQGWSQLNLVGSNAYMGVNLQRSVLTKTNDLKRLNISNSGTRVGSVPIEITIDRMCNKNEPLDHRNVIICACVEKQLTIKQGQVYVKYV